MNDLTENMSRIRIAYRFKNSEAASHGQWHPEAERKNLMITVNKLNREYPEIIHWIEDENIASRQFTDCDNCQRNLADCECRENQMPVCNICAFPQVNCVCDSPKNLEETI